MSNDARNARKAEIVRRAQAFMHSELVVETLLVEVVPSADVSPRVQAMLGKLYDEGYRDGLRAAGGLPEPDDLPGVDQNEHEDPDEE